MTFWAPWLDLGVPYCLLIVKSREIFNKKLRWDVVSYVNLVFTFVFPPRLFVLRLVSVVNEAEIMQIFRAKSDLQEKRPVLSSSFAIHTSNVVYYRATICVHYTID